MKLKHGLTLLTLCSTVNHEESKLCRYWQNLRNVHATR